MPKLQTLYQNAIKFAAKKHADQNQVISGTNIPYVVHLSNVAMEILIASEKTKEFNAKFAVQVALLHDILEDTETTFEELAQEFNEEIAQAVLALTKNSQLPKEEKMKDSLERIKKLSKEVWAVKLADRITNLQIPPKIWTLEKIKEYQKEASEILHELNGSNDYLEKRLSEKIIKYSKYITAEV
ncbi:guanosine-3',5'-bis(diphosphate) 3'-pyrophosphohydrolase [Flavobacterium sp. 270]|uniref:HD domain-containing protein n=1 Tax=Flavobacterium sp. 270 TaxID=2512114 RepID=UPI00106545DC|nr:HD domain-containing protein [Flavobacterium sp. 270]TDW45827.1 guanosine-3',5'-bis(diphosphate) 3'-pyrophosphohydrolase [Flavobacterium sp. 270]